VILAESRRNFRHTPVTSDSIVWVKSPLYTKLNFNLRFSSRKGSSYKRFTEYKINFALMFIQLSKVTVLLEVAPLILVGTNDVSEVMTALIMEAVSTSDISFIFYENTRYNFSEDRHLQTHRREKIKFRTLRLLKMGLFWVVALCRLL
jgi:hypothetical protein